MIALLALFLVREGFAPSGHAQWTIVQAFGLFLTMIGTVVAGVALYAEMAGKALPTHWVRMIRPIVNWVQSHVLGRSMDHVIAVGMAGEVQFTGGGLLAVVGHASSEDPGEERLRRIESDLAGLRATFEHEQTRLADQLREIQEASNKQIEGVRREASEREAQNREVDTLVKTQEMLGVVLVGVGTVLSGIAGFCI